MYGFCDFGDVGTFAEEERKKIRKGQLLVDDEKLIFY
jgi:hypothetical protein